MMCVGLEVLGIIGSLAGTAMSAMGAIQQGNAAAASAEYNAQIAEQNRFIADRNAADARTRGNAAQQEQQMKTQAMLGRQRAIMASRHVDMASGSPLEILGDTAMFGKLDQMKVSDAHEREAIGHQTQGMNFSAQAELNRMEADNARTAGGISAFTSLAQGFGNFRKMTIR